MENKLWGQVVGIVLAAVLLGSTTAQAQVISQMPLVVAKPVLQKMLSDEKNVQENRGSGFVASAYPVMSKSRISKTEEAKATK
jgi:hypothetical protein